MHSLVTVEDKNVARFGGGMYFAAACIGIGIGIGVCVGVCVGVGSAQCVCAIFAPAIQQNQFAVDDKQKTVDARNAILREMNIVLVVVAHTQHRRRFGCDLLSGQTDLVFQCELVIVFHIIVRYV